MAEKRVVEMTEEELKALIVEISTKIVNQHMEQPLKKSIKERLAYLAPEHRTPELIRYIEIMESDVLPDDYDEANDPTIGMFEGPPDLAERTEEILQAGFGQRKNMEDQ